jgi:hypothetical protein
LLGALRIADQRVGPAISIVGIGPFNTRRLITMSQETKSKRTTGSFEERASKRSSGIVREFWDFLRNTKKWWLTPIILLLLLISALVMLSGTAAAPFIYTLF